MKALEEKIEALKQEISQTQIPDADALEQFRIRYLGTKNIIKDLFAEMKNIAPADRKQAGQLLNGLKNLATDTFNILKADLENQNAQAEASRTDYTRPSGMMGVGSRHPVRLVRRQMLDIFAKMGFNVSYGPEIEDDFHNFTALNFPPDHPAREMQDTFFLNRNPDVLLRTHTSTVQVRVMENQKPPIRTVAPGRVYRNEAISARAHVVFHQVEGLYIDTKVSFADLKHTLYHFVRQLFGPDTQIRFRPSYFPFTEPSAEVDVSCFICGGKGCNVCKHTGWVEIAGSGMVDPNVLEACGIDPNQYTGYAFGIGVERTTMLRYQINDLRKFTDNDVRFLSQFAGL